MKAKRKQYSPSFNAKVAAPPGLTLVGGSEALDKDTFAELSKQCEVHPTMIGKWKQEFLDRAASVFEKLSDAQSEEQINPNQLSARMGRL